MSFSGRSGTLRTRVADGESRIWRTRANQRRWRRSSRSGCSMASEADYVRDRDERGASKPLLDPAAGKDSGEGAAKPALSGRALLLVLFTVLTSIATLEKVALKKAVDSMGDTTSGIDHPENYQIMLNQVVVLLFAFLFTGIVEYKKRVREMLPQKSCRVRTQGPALCLQVCMQP